MTRSVRPSQGYYPGLVAILAFLCWQVAAAPARAQDVVVNSAEPPAAEQGTVNLDVVIGGSGFKKGAVARFLVSGSENPGGITVNSTTFKSGGQLIANITVAADASLSKFDIEVTNTSGRRGKGIELFSVQEKGSGTIVEGSGSLMWGVFTNSPVNGQRIRSDSQATPCGYDYVDSADPCTGSVDPTGAVIPNAEQASISHSLGTDYRLRTVPACCVPTIDSADSDWEPYIASPSRWLVLDFSDPVGASPCLGIDTSVAAKAAGTDWEEFGLPTAQPPPADEDTADGRCVDNVAVRFIAEGALSGNGTASLRIHIDEPQVSGTGTKKNPSWRLQWNAIYTLRFQQPLLATTDAFGNLILQTGGCGDCDLADLMEGEQTKRGRVVGTYHVPFSLRLRRPQ